MGVEPGDRVALYLPKSVDTVAAILGTIQAGAVYVPLDVKSPIAYNLEILRSCEATCVISAGGLAQSLQEYSRDEFKLIDMHKVLNSDECYSREWSSKSPNNPTYILYTSGSTGRPKGAVHTHRSALAFLDQATELLDPTPKDIFASVAPFHFDLSILDIFTPLKHGASAWLVDQDLLLNPRKLMRELHEVGPTIWYSTPSVLRLLLRHVRSEDLRYLGFRWVLFAGEPMSPKDLTQLMDAWPGARFLNIYGCTETNNTFHYEIEGPPKGNEIPIGHPNNGVDVRIVDSNGNKVSPGKEGELCVSSSTLMSKYWKEEEFTASVLIQEADGRIWYRTGDMAVYSSNGVHWLRGRIDRMFKRAGHRIHPAEIERVLEDFSEVAEAAVLPYSRNDLLAFIRLRKPISVDAITTALLKRLAAIKCPSRIIPVDSMPLTTTGKVDYGQLLEGVDDRNELPVERDINGSAPDPITFVQNWLRHETQQEDILAEQNFSTIGLDSIRVLDLLSAVYRNFGLEISAVQFSPMSAWADLLTAINTEGKAKTSANTTLKGQPRSFLIDRLVEFAPQGIDPTTNLVEQHNLSGVVPESVLRSALQQVFLRHGALRAYISRKNGIGTIAVSALQDMPLQEVWIPTDRIGETEAWLDEIRYKAASHRFGWDPEARLRITLAHLPGQESALILVAHHAWADLVSLRILFEEIWALVEQEISGKPANLQPPRPFQNDLERLYCGQLSPEGWQREDQLANLCAEVRDYQTQTPSEEDHGPCLVLEEQLKPQLIEAIRARARASSTSLHALCILAALRTRQHHQGQGNVALTSVLDRRAVSPGIPSVGHYLNYPNFLLTQQMSNHGLQVMIQEIANQFQDARRSLCCEAVGRTLKLPGDYPFQSWSLNFVGEDTNQVRRLSNDTIVTRTEPIQARSHHGWHMHVEVRDTLYFRLLCRGSDFETGQAQNSLSRFQEELACLASES